MEKKRDWKEFLIKASITAIISLFVALLAAYLFTFIIEPSIEKPNLEMIAKEPIFFREGELVTFNITIENTGRATARELLICAYEESENEKSQSDCARGHSDILQAGDVMFAEFEMTAPDNQQSYWLIEIYATTTDGFRWNFHLKYDYEPETEYYVYKKY